MNSRSPSAGRPRAAILPAETAEAGPGQLGSPTLLREYLPISVDGKVLGVVGIWRDAVPILERLASVRRDVVLVTLSAALIAAALLFLIFRAAQRRLTRQTAELIESTRRDPLTGTLNHGAVVGRLAMETEAARAAGRPVTIALIDIDNFRLLNENHGHPAGDEALLAVAGLLRGEVVEPMVLGRSGPDEFLIIAPPAVAFELEPLVTRLQTGLVDLSLQFELTERLPITVSVGIATYPEHAASATALLSTATFVLEEAKASGGDTIRMASNASLEETSATSTFNVLEGLILAVDTKDRYTKRHSEDVARYAMFLASRLGLDADELRVIQTAGLLHDVGKIGIPDHILRKPGKLTAAEFDIVKQHVALGDMIVRDLPDLDQVRAGIRHHHERWDGDGYLERLEGEDIPLIARILAVADAFSAMTTTRPYRKALDLREALNRLGDAAGTQLEERLVVAFVDGMETAADAPIPGRRPRARSGHRAGSSRDRPGGGAAFAARRRGRVWSGSPSHRPRCGVCAPADAPTRYSTTHDRHARRCHAPGVLANDLASLGEHGGSRARIPRHGTLVFTIERQLHVHAGRWLHRHRHLPIPPVRSAS